MTTFPISFPPIVYKDSFCGVILNNAIHFVQLACGNLREYVLSYVDTVLNSIWTEKHEEKMFVARNFFKQII